MDERQSKPFVVERWIVVGIRENGQSLFVPLASKKQAEDFSDMLRAREGIIVLAIEHVKWTYD